MKQTKFRKASNKANGRRNKIKLGWTSFGVRSNVDVIIRHLKRCITLNHWHCDGKSGYSTSITSTNVLGRSFYRLMDFRYTIRKTANICCCILSSTGSIASSIVWTPKETCALSECWDRMDVKSLPISEFAKNVGLLVYHFMQRQRFVGGFHFRIIGWLANQKKMPMQLVLRLSFVVFSDRIIGSREMTICMDRTNKVEVCSGIAQPSFCYQRKKSYFETWNKVLNLTWNHMLH